MKIQADITWENDWGGSNVLFYQFRFVDFSYEKFNLCQPQHHFTLMILGLGVFITFYGKVDAKCKKRLDKESWDDEPIVKRKKVKTKRKSK